VFLVLASKINIHTQKRRSGTRINGSQSFFSMTPLIFNKFSKNHLYSIKNAVFKFKNSYVSLSY